MILIWRGLLAWLNRWFSQANSRKFQSCDDIAPKTQIFWFLIRCWQSHQYNVCQFLVGIFIVETRMVSYCLQVPEFRSCGKCLHSSSLFINPRISPLTMKYDQHNQTKLLWSRRPTQQDQSLITLFHVNAFKAQAFLSTLIFSK